MDIAAYMKERINSETQRVKDPAVFTFHYEPDCACPGCGDTLAMVKDGQCRCEQCGKAFDPTVEFQRCVACGGQPSYFLPSASKP